MGQDGLLVRMMTQEKQPAISSCKLALLVSEVQCDRVLRDGVDPRETKSDKLDYLVDMAQYQGRLT